jgi:hypothetical protein
MRFDRKSMATGTDGKKSYQLSGNRKYVPNRLDASEYPGKSLYRPPLVVEQGPADVAARSAGASPAPGLLNSHISSRSEFNPYDEGRIELWQHAGLIKVTKQGRHLVIAEGASQPKRRGTIQEFSNASRRRMMHFLAKVVLVDDNLPLFGTTTYPDMFPGDGEKFKRDIRTLIERLKRRFPEIGLLWRLEFKVRRSGLNVGKVAPHFHWLLWNVPEKFDYKTETGKWAKMTQAQDGTWQQNIRFREGEKIVSVVNPVAVGCQDRFTEWLSRNWYDVAGTGDLRHYRAGTNVKELTSKHAVFCYVSKYMGKVEDDLACPFPGRFWGVVNPKNIPMGKRIVLKCTGKQAAKLMRFMRRYVRSIMGKKWRFNYWSMNCMCNADFWAARIPRLLEAEEHLGNRF